MDPLATFKDSQRQTWANFVPMETFTGTAAPKLVRLAQLQAGARVLDVACGTGVVALTAARAGARVTGLDLTPELLARARENGALTGLDVDWHEGDVEALPFGDAAFDVVLSQFGHMFAPRPEVAVREMLRVLKPGGTIAFSTWPPDLFIGRFLGLVARYSPPPPAGVPSPLQWGDPNVVRERLGRGVRELHFDSDRLAIPTLSPQHQREFLVKNNGPFKKLAQALSADAPKLQALQDELESLLKEYFADNFIRQDFLMTRAIKV